jgi:hypothetical protein
MFRLTILLLLLLSATGCVRRRLTVRSVPAGATVYVDDQPVGQTPASTPFTYYGTRKIQLVKDNYETLTVKQRFNPPWYEWPVLEFFSENLWPWEVRDERVVDFQLIPQVIVPTERLLENGQQLREAAGQGAITPLMTPGERPTLPPAAPVESRYPLPPQQPEPELRPPGRVLP